MVYIFAGLLIAIALVFTVIARKKIKGCKTDEERRLVKAKWQLICGLMGAACLIILSIVLYINF